MRRVLKPFEVPKGQTWLLDFTPEDLLCQSKWSLQVPSREEKNIYIHKEILPTSCFEDSIQRGRKEPSTKPSPKSPPIFCKPSLPRSLQDLLLPWNCQGPSCCVRTSVWPHNTCSSSSLFSHPYPASHSKLGDPILTIKNPLFRCQSQTQDLWDKTNAEMCQKCHWPEIHC